MSSFILPIFFSCDLQNDSICNVVVLFLFLLMLCHPHLVIMYEWKCFANWFLSIFIHEKWFSASKFSIKGKWLDFAVIHLLHPGLFSARNLCINLANLVNWLKWSMSGSGSDYVLEHICMCRWIGKNWKCFVSWLMCSFRRIEFLFFRSHSKIECHFIKQW